MTTTNAAARSLLILTSMLASPDLVSTALAGEQMKAAIPPVFELPRLSTPLTIDGSGSDWAECGLHTGALLDPENEAPAAGFSASARLAWDESGLWIFVETRGGSGVEADNSGALYQASSIEIFASPNHFNGADPAEPRIVLQPILSAGRDPRHPRARCYIYDNRTEELTAAAPPECDFAATHEGNSASYEVRIPWTQFGITPREGLPFGLQIHANDADSPARRTQLRWNTAPGKGQALVLSAGGSGHTPGTATASFTNGNGIRVVVQTMPERTIRAEAAHASAQAVSDTDGQAVLHLPMPDWSDAGSPIRVMDDSGKTFAWIELPDATKARHAILESMPLTFSGDNVFADSAFPELDPLPDVATTSLIEPGSLRVRFFDSSGNESTQAASPGRYFAIVSLRSRGGKEITRRIDLFRSKQEIDSHLARSNEELAAAAGVPEPQTDDDHRLFDSVRQHVFDNFPKRIFNRAATLSALHERDHRPVRVMTARLNAWYRLDQRLGKVEPIRHLALLPPGHEEHPQKSWPVVVYLHGTGWHSESSALKEPIRTFWQDRPERSFILLQPLAPHGTSWVPDQLIDWLEKTLPEIGGDPSRVILTGFSMGGIGTWNVACAHPDRFAAFIPLASVGEHAPVDAVAGKPVWCFHGEKDAMPFLQAKMWTDRLRKLDPSADVRLTLLENIDHTNTTQNVYPRPELWAWMQKLFQP